MTNVKSTLAAMLAIATMATSADLMRTVPLAASESRCTLVPGTTLALIRVEQDTTLPFSRTGVQPMSGSGVRPSPDDSLLANASTLMPAARVRVLQIDSSSRATLASFGISASQPTAFIRAAPYRADCRTVRWTDSSQFVVRGDVGYVRGTLAARDQWIDGVPVFVIPDSWNYPYPRHRSLAFGAGPKLALAPADAIFSLDTTLEMPRTVDVAARFIADSARRLRATAWAVANPRAADLEPARTKLRRAILDPDWNVARTVPSRLRGTYRVDVDAGAERGTWFFRTHDRPGYAWDGGDSLQTTAQMLKSPHVLGYQLVGYAAASRDSIPGGLMNGSVRVPLVWLSTTDRPTVADNDARRVLSAILEFTLAGAPETLWNDLETFARPQTALDSLVSARMNRPMLRSERQPRIPLTVRLDVNGRIHGDTTLRIGARKIKVAIERVDTLSVKRPF